MILLSSVIAGALWAIVDPAAPFFLGAVTALLALVALVILRPQVAVPQRG